MAFRQYFFDTPEVTKIVLQNFKLYLLIQATAPKSFVTEWMLKIPKGFPFSFLSIVRLH